MSTRAQSGRQIGRSRSERAEAEEKWINDGARDVDVPRKKARGAASACATNVIEHI